MPSVPTRENLSFKAPIHAEPIVINVFTAGMIGGLERHWPRNGVSP